MTRHFGFPLLALLAVGVALYAFVGYSARPLGANVHPDMRSAFQSRPTAIYLHIFGSAVALLVGPAQFSTALRVARPKLHGALGRVYLVGVIVGGLAGLWIAPFAFGGWVSTAGFGLLALLWLFAGARAFQTAHARDFVSHERWAVRSFALTFSAVTLRIGLGIGFASGLPFELFYPALAWLCWVPNLVAAERLIRAPVTSRGS